MLKRLMSFLLFGAALFVSNEVDARSPPDKKVPILIRRDYKKLAHYLTDSLAYEEAKVRNLFSWVTSNIRYDVKAFQNDRDKIYSPNQILMRRKAVCQGYSDLFKALCNEVSIKAEVVDGYAKTFEYNKGDQFFKPEHAWNAVKIDGQWRLMDLTWSSGYLRTKSNWFIYFWGSVLQLPFISPGLKFVQQPDTLFYNMRPQQFIVSHAPTDPIWQLLEAPVTIKQFEADSTRYENDSGYVRPPPASSSGTLEIFLGETPLNKIIWRAERASGFNPKNRRPVLDKEMALGDSVISVAVAFAGVERDSIMKIAGNHYGAALGCSSSLRGVIKTETDLLLNKNNRKKEMLFGEDARLLGTNRAYVHRTFSRYIHFRNTAERTKDYLKVIAEWRSRGLIANIHAVPWARKSKPALVIKLNALTDALIEGRQKAELKKQEAVQSQILFDSVTRSLSLLFDSTYQMCYGQLGLLIGENNLRTGMRDSYSPGPQELKVELKGIKDSVERPLLSALPLLSDSLKRVFRTTRSNWLLARSIYIRDLGLIRQMRRVSLPNHQLIAQYRIESDSLMHCLTHFSKSTDHALSAYIGVASEFRMLSGLYGLQVKKIFRQKKIELLRFKWTRKHLYRKREKELKRNDKLQRTITARINLVKYLRMHPAKQGLRYIQSSCLRLL